ncbi:hypothetical protein FNT36_11730 [Hymenobacter setariae]|uniref:Uncharacterized protein n=1 Tax=Hymenobacter setariae TaxID=2594794 RepID=A0A558BUG0_9BACT|nr:hypothetical protein [Hymenobacter setariae]TVT40158.1 hypothetical protein FNT36_11730 [Hymenobacter setariae]
MKLTHLLVAAALFSTSAALAQTTPVQGAQKSPATLTPSSAAPALNPNSAANATRDIPATGAPDAIDNTPLDSKDKRATNSKKQKNSMSSGKGKMKTKM